MRRSEALVLAGSILFTACAERVRPTQAPTSTESATPTAALPTENLTEPLLSPEDIIWQEIARKGIQVSPNEQNIWAGSYEQTPDLSSSLNPIDAATTAINRATDTLNLMGQSENPFFRGAETTLRILRDNQRLEIVPGVADDPSVQTPAVTIEGDFDDSGTFNVSLVIWERFALDESNALIMANALTHAANTANFLTTFADSLDPSLSPSEKERRTLEYANQNMLTATASGFAEEAQALIYEAGVLGRIYNVPQSGGEDRAARFITSGGINSKEWIEYIKQITTEQPNPPGQIS